MPAPVRCLDNADVLMYVQAECFRPAETGLVGIELEYLTARTDGSDDPPHFDDVRRRMQAALPLPCGSAVTYEPGGQLELSTPPLPGPGAACAAAATDSRAAAAALAPSVSLLAVGMHPDRMPERVLHEPRYTAMERYFDADGPEGRAMMGTTAALQVNLDIGTPETAATRWRRVHALGPVLAAAFANSPLSAGRPTGWRSSRLAAWSAIDETRTAPAHTNGAPPADEWARYALDARVMLIRDGGDFEPVVPRLTFAEWIEHGHPLGWPDVDDLAYHLTTLFPPVRPRGWLELRMLDALPDPWWQVAVWVTTTLVDEPTAAAAAAPAAAAQAGKWTAAARLGLGDHGLAQAASLCFDAALAGMRRLGAGSDVMAAAAEYRARYVDRARCPADDILDEHCRELMGA